IDRSILIVKHQLLPSRILACSRSSDDIIAALKEIDPSAPPPHPALQLLPTSDFSFATGKQHLLSFFSRSQRHGFNRKSSQQGFDDQRDLSEVELIGGSKTAAWLKIGGMVDVEGKESVACVAALFSHIQKVAPIPSSRFNGVDTQGDAAMDEGQYNGGEADELFIGTSVIGVESFALGKFLQISEDTLRSLSVFIDEAHTNSRSNRNKEGLSIFGLLNSTRTSAGKASLRSWCVRPSQDLNVLSGRHDAVEILTKIENAGSVEFLLKAINSVGNMRNLVSQVRTGLSLQDWGRLLSFTFNAAEVQTRCRELHLTPFIKRVPILDRIAREIDVETLKGIGGSINTIVDFDDSGRNGKVQIKHGVDEELDELKRTYEGLGDLLTSIGNDVQAELPLGDITVVYFPQLGYLIASPKTAGESLDVEGLTFQFETDAIVYYKNDRMRQLDQELGDLHAMIADREIEWIQQLTDRAIEGADSILGAYDVIGELDCLLALADAARKYRYKRPMLTEDNVIKIVNGRHPIQELCVEIFVANGTQIGPEEPGSKTSQVFILSGANYSGKSVYLKQVALIVFMSHVGSFVPAEYALIGLTDRILTRLQTKDSVSKMQSTFMSDLQHVSLALKNSTERSLIIIDEFGKGTATTDGVGMFCGVIEALLDRDCVLFCCLLRICDPVQKYSTTTSSAKTHVWVLIQWKLSRTKTVTLPSCIGK
ncbi:hypothetical protein M427DRAFT_319157, partial [Gonapodya prolifera JEL478]